jgi:CubicO group peptidase (beta-lactamase class C family)
MKRTFSFFLAFTVISIGYAQPTDTIKQIDVLFSQWNNSTPGGAILVTRDNKVLYNKAFGLADLEHNTPNTTETIFESGSVAKQFTAASIFVLASEGKLALGDDVRKYIPELPVYHATITIQHLLNHTSGLKDWGVIGSLSGWPRTTRVYTQDLALQIMCRQKSLNFTPGSEYSYSNSNYSLLVTIVERVSKQSLADFTRTRFFEPLEMNHTQWRDNFREVVPNRAIAYSKSGSDYQQNMPFENVHGHGGLLTTTSDLAKWNTLLETYRIGGEQVFKWRTKKGKLNNGKEISYAGGISVNNFNEFTEISHSGATAGYRAWLAYYPQKKLSIVVLSNDAGFGVVQAGHKIAELFMKPIEKQKKERPSIILSESDLKRFAGTYKSIREFDVMTLDYKDGKLLSNVQTLQAAHRDTLYAENLIWIATKSNTKSNQVDAILLKNSQDTSSYQRVNPPELNSNALRSLNGNYYSEEADTHFTVEVKGGDEIWVHNKPHASIKLTPSFKDGYLSDDFELYEFRRDKKGNVTGFEVSMSRAERIQFVKKK